MEGSEDDDKSGLPPIELSKVSSPAKRSGGLRKKKSERLEETRIDKPVHSKYLLKKVLKRVNQSVDHGIVFLSRL